MRTHRSHDALRGDGPAGWIIGDGPRASSSPPKIKSKLLPSASVVLLSLLLAAAIAAFMPTVAMDIRIRHSHSIVGGGGGGGKGIVSSTHKARHGVGMSGGGAGAGGRRIGGNKGSAGGVGVGGGGGESGRSGQRVPHLYTWSQLPKAYPETKVFRESGAGAGSGAGGFRGAGNTGPEVDDDAPPAAPVDPEHNSFNPFDWYQGTRRPIILDRMYEHLQSKVLTRTEIRRYGTFKSHLQLDTPQAVDLMTIRPKHDGDTLRVRWPPDSPDAPTRPVHLTLHKRQFLEDGMLGTSRLHGRSGQAQLAYLAVGKGGTTVLGKFGFDPLAVKQLPREEVKWKFGTCAVVSNSGELLRQKMGNEIDDHHAVFRINYPPIEGFTEQVGSKTTLELVNHHHARELALSEGYLARRFIDPTTCVTAAAASVHSPLPIYCTHAVECIKGECYTEPRRNPTLDGEGPSRQRPTQELSTLVILESMDSSGWRYSFLAAILERFPPPMAMVVSPDFLMAADEMWRKVSANVSEGGVSCRQVTRRAEERAETSLELQAPKLDKNKQAVKHDGVRSFASIIGAEEGCKPTTGWFAILLALQVCDNVDAYGFSSWKRRTSHKPGASMYHYFDKVEGVDNVHSFDLTLDVLQQLVEYYPLKLRGGLPSEEPPSPKEERRQ
mmetsp:Transcript_18669/g.29885  ORF Transcript_18669/g.29885 Transcript_18669/m.29885 type:complete len:665 (+) Transcript_18669:90-2084(+)